MKINARRDMLKNIKYGVVIYTIDNLGKVETDDPLIVLNADYKDTDDFVLCASLHDGTISSFDDTTIVELADVSLVINNF